MLDLYGRGYVVEHCLNEIEMMLRERQYRAYVTDALMVVANNVAQALGGSQLQSRWMDTFKEPDTRTPEEIARDVVKNAWLKPKGGEGNGFIQPDGTIDA